MNTRTAAVLFLAVFASFSQAQTIRTLGVSAEPQPARAGLFSVRIAADGDRAAPWPTQRVAWMFWRTGDRQENRHYPQPREDQSVLVDLAQQGGSVVGVDLAPEIQSLSRKQWLTFLGRVSSQSMPVLKNEMIRVRRVESLAAIVRPETDRSGASPIIVSKLGLNAEIRPLLDPTRILLNSDMPFRIYVGGVSVTGQRVLATHIASRETISITTRSGGFGDLHIMRPGAWRIEFHQITMSEDDAADIDLVSGILTFSIPEGGK